MFKKVLFTFLMTLCVSTLAQQAAGGKSKEEKVEVVLGISKVIKVDFVPFSTVDIDNKSVIDVQLIPQKREIRFKGKKPGRSSVIVRDRATKDIAVTYLVNVTATEKSRIVRELTELIGDVEGIDIGIKGNKVYVGGKIIVPGDIGKVVVILQDYKDVVNLIEVSPQTYQIIARKMQEGMKKNNLRDVSVRFFNNSYLLEGIVNSEAEKNLAYDLAAAYLPDRIESLARRTDAVQSVQGQEIIKNFIVVNTKKPPPPASKLVKLTAQFVELSKDYNKVFGFKWEPVMGGSGGEIAFGKTTSGGVTTNSNRTLSGTISGLFPKLNSAKAAGHARVIQSAVIIVKDQKEANISKTTKKNFSLGSSEFSRPVATNTGLDLKIKPTILQEEKVNLDISFSVSSAVSTDELKNNIKTEVVVRSKESAVIGGVAVNKSTTEYDKDPPGGGSNIEGGFPLFSFIRSKEVTKSKEQFVVFVTPEVVESAAAGTEEIKKKFRRRGL